MEWFNIELAIGITSTILIALLWFFHHKIQRQEIKLTRERLEIAHQKLHIKVRNAIEQENRQAAITAFSAMLNQSLEIKRVIEVAIDMVKEIMQVDAVLIFSLDKNAKQLRITAFDGVNQSYASVVDGMKIGEGFCGRVAKTGQPLIIEDSFTDTELARPEAKDENLRTQVSVPLQSRGKIIGTLCAATKSPRQFSHSEIELLTMIGNLIGIAMENSSLNKERSAATEKLKHSEKKYRKLFENAHDAIWVQDLSGKITDANRAASEIFGCTLSELIGTDVKNLLSQEGIALSGKIQDKLLHGQDMPQPYMLKLTKKDGSEAILTLTTNLISSNGHPGGLQFIGRDITNEVRMQENQQFYLQQITRAHEEERQRISRDLHDSTAQNLIGVLHQLENFCQTDEYLPMPRLRSLWSFHERLKDSLQEIRQLSRDLRPSILDHLGLLPSVDWLAEQLRTEHKIAADLIISGKRRRYSPEIEVTLFRIVQEALRNIARHSKATKVRIAIDLKDSETRVTITDNGQGFELPTSLGELSRLGKLGLDGMQTRARLVGGSFEILSTPDAGTTLFIRIPA